MLSGLFRRVRRALGRAGGQGVIEVDAHGLRPADAVLVGYLGHPGGRLAGLFFRSPPIALDHLASAAGIAQDLGLTGSSRLMHRLMRWVDRTALRTWQDYAQCRDLVGANSQITWLAAS